MTTLHFCWQGSQNIYLIRLSPNSFVLCLGFRFRTIFWLFILVGFMFMTQCDLVFHNTNIICLHVIDIFLIPWIFWITSYQFAGDHPLVQTPLVGMMWRAMVTNTSLDIIPKKLLSHHTTWALAWINIVEFDILSNTSLTSLHNPN